MKLSTLLLVPAALAATLSAQTQTVRGQVENVKNTQNQFFLDCTTIPLVSSKLNLNLLAGHQNKQEYVLQVINKGTAANPVLDVQSATPTTKVFDMGNLRIGRSDRWQVRWKPGSDTVIAVTLTSWTGYAPMGPLGTFLLGPNFIIFNSGRVNQLGVFEFSYRPPNIPTLVGTSFTGQALVREPNGFQFLSNPDCKEVRSK